MDLDLALKIEKLISLMNSSASKERRNYEK